MPNRSVPNIVRQGAGSAQGFALLCESSGASMHTGLLFIQAASRRAAIGACCHDAACDEGWPLDKIRARFDNMHPSVLADPSPGSLD